jgi:phenylpropionate dioxygenase-like ring-hydroxylating dioxygenase large terminal subunit
MTSYIDRILNRAPDGAIEVRCGVQKYEYSGNWKFQIENFVDHYHAPFTHESSLVSQAGREGYRARFLNQDVRDAAEIRAFAHGHVVMDHPRERRADLTGPDEYVRKMGEVYGKERAEEILTQNLHLAVFPNLLFQEHSQSYRVVLPVSVDRTRVFVYPYRLKGAPDGYNSQRIRAVTLTVSATGFMQPDDLEALTRAQEGLQAEGPQWVILARGIQHESSGPFGERVSGRGTDETGIRGLCRYWKELMDASGGQQPGRGGAYEGERAHE